MFKSLRAPEGLFQLATWLVSFVFAGFLIGLGSKIVGELPGVDRRVAIEQFADAKAMASLRVRADSLQALGATLRADRSRAELVAQEGANAYRSKREAFDNWIAARTATTDPKQDPEVVRRTRELDELEATRRRAQEAVEALDARLLGVAQAQEEQRQSKSVLEKGAEGPFQRAVFVMQLRVFGLRLLITLPLLIAAIWLFAKKRKSQYWPLARGFVLFALFTFFVELVPYLPSYGGYVRYIVGIVLTAVAGHYLIRAMQRYVARRALAAQQTEDQRRGALGYEEAIKKMTAQLCPGCERPIVGGTQGSANFCVHCGMTLFDTCGACHTRKNAFFQFCPSCGVAAIAPIGAGAGAAAAIS